MRCPKCGFDQPDGGTECIKCGIVFSKYITKQKISSQEILNDTGPVSPAKEHTGPEETPDYYRELFFYVNPGAGIFSLLGRGLLLLVLFSWGLNFISSSIESNYSGKSFLHLINLPFHEAGHILFSMFGQLM